MAEGGFGGMLSRKHIYVMLLTSTEPTFLFCSIILTNSIAEYKSQAKPRRESNPNLVQHFFFDAALQATAPHNSRTTLAQNGVYIPTLFQKSKVLLVLGTLYGVPFVK